MGNIFKNPPQIWKYPMKKILISSFLLAVSSNALATESIQKETTEAESPQAVNSPKVSGFYLGAGYGSFTYNAEQNWDDDSRYGNLIKETDGNSLKIYGGYQFNKIIAVEATYTDYGNTNGYVNTRNGIQRVEQSPTSLAVAANAGYSFANGLRPFGLVGLSYLTLDSSYDFLDTDNPIAIKYGVGVDYAPSALKGIQLRVAYEGEVYFAEAETYGFDDDVNVDLFSLGAFYAGASYKF